MGVVAGDSTLLDRALRSPRSVGLARVPPSLTYTSPVLLGEYLTLPGRTVSLPEVRRAFRAWPPARALPLGQLGR